MYWLYIKHGDCFSGWEMHNFLWLRRILLHTPFLQFHVKLLHTSCLFLKDSEYPAESVPDEWSQYKHTTYVPSSIGYFAALYNSNGEPAVGIDGLYFNDRWDWYQYLRQFPDLNVPTHY